MLKNFLPCPTMVGLIVDSGYERRSSTPSANSVYTISKMAPLFANTKVKIAFSIQLSTSTLKMFLRANYGGPYSRNAIQENI